MVLRICCVALLSLRSSRPSLLTAAARSSPHSQVVIMFPDEAESKIAIENYGTSAPFPGVSSSSLRQSDPDDNRVFKPEQVFLSLIGGSAGQVKAIDGAEMYIIIVASAQELPDVEELHKQAPDR